MKFSTALGIAILACIAIGLTMSLKDSVNIPDFRKEMSEVKVTVSKAWQEAQIEAQRKQALKPPEKFTLKMNNQKGEFDGKPLDYGQVTRQGNVLHCTTGEKYYKVHDLQFGGTRYIAWISIDLDNYSGTWSVKYPDGEKTDQGGRLIVVPATGKGYKLTFLDGTGSYHGDGTFYP